MWSLLSALAYAGVPVVHDGPDPDGAVSAVTARSGLERNELDLVDIRTLNDTDPIVIGTARLTPCTASRSAVDAVQNEYNRSAGAFAHVRDGEAIQAADDAVALMGCLGEPMSTELGGKLFLLRGVIEASRTGETNARSEFRTALDFDPGLTWDARFPPDGQQWFEEEQQTKASHTVTLHPMGSNNGPWLDGHSLEQPATARAGLHLVQWTQAGGVVSGFLALVDQTTLVAPRSYGATPLAAMADEAGWPGIAALLHATQPGWRSAYVVHSGGVWLVDFESNEVQQLQPITVETAEPEAEVDSRKGRKKKRAR